MANRKTESHFVKIFGSYSQALLEKDLKIIALQKELGAMKTRLSDLFELEEVLNIQRRFNRLTKSN